MAKKLKHGPPVNLFLPHTFLVCTLGYRPFQVHLYTMHFGLQTRNTSININQPQHPSHTSRSRAWRDKIFCKRMGFRVRLPTGTCPPFCRRISTTRAKIRASDFVAPVTSPMAVTNVIRSAVQGNNKGSGGQKVGSELMLFVSFSFSLCSSCSVVLFAVCRLSWVWRSQQHHQ